MAQNDETSPPQEESTESPPAVEGENPFRFVTLNEYCALPADPQKWIVRKLIPVGGMVNLYAKPKVGKALDIDTPLLTPSGWTTIAEVVPGDFVFGSNGQPTQVIATSPVEQRESYRLTFGDGTEIVADAEHLWTVRTTRHNPGQHVKTTKELLEAGVTIRAGSNKPRPRWHVTLTGALEFNTNHQLPLDPYLLGVWLGDGHKHDGAITSADSQIVDVFTLRGWTVRKRTAPYAYGIKGLRVVLRQMGLLNNKHIPLDYMTAPREQRLELLRGLMDTDGWANDGVAEFTNTNEVLAQQVLELCQQLGFKAKMRTKPATLYGKDCGLCYTVTVRAYENVFKLERKQTAFKLNKKECYWPIVAIEPVGVRKVKCLVVDAPDSLFLVGPNCIPTHNSYLMLGIIESIIQQQSDWCGFEILKWGPVMYLQIDTPREEWMDRAKQMQLRLKEQGHGDRFWLADMWNIPNFPFNILDPSNTELTWLQNEVARIKPILVVIDTLREVHSGDENDNTVMRNVVARLIQACRGEVGSPTAIVLISHQRKDGIAMEQGHDDMMDQNRGASYISGKMDMILRLTRKRLTYKGRAVGLEHVEVEQDPLSHLVVVKGHQKVEDELKPLGDYIRQCTDQTPGLSKNELAKRLAAKFEFSQSTAIRKIDEWVAVMEQKEAERATKAKAVDLKSESPRTGRRRAPPRSR